MRPAWAYSSQDPISKMAGGMAQAVEHLLCECKALSSKPTPTNEMKNRVGSM
jgi:hypothetical protein